MDGAVKPSLKRTSSPIACILLLLTAGACVLPRAADAPPAIEARRSAMIAETGGFAVRVDSTTTIAVRAWPAASPRAALLILHGIGFEAAPYEVVARGLNHRGISVFAMDLRNHGLSDGPRGVLPPVSVLANDVVSVLTDLRMRESDRPLFLLGESLGALAAAEAATIPGSANGVIFVAPAFEPHPNQWFGPDAVVTAVIATLAPRSPFISITGRSLELSSRDSAFIALRRSDPLAQQAVSPSYLLQYNADAQRVRRTVPERLTIPLLVLVGEEDNVVRSESAERFLRESSSRRKRFHLYPEARHTLFWDPVAPDLFRDIADWIDRITAAEPAT